MYVLLGGLVAICATAAALLCLAAMAQVEVRMLTLLSGGDGARMRPMVEQFNASQTEVRVVSTTLRCGEPFYNKLITASVVGAGPTRPRAAPA